MYYVVKIWYSRIYCCSVANKNLARVSIEALGGQVVCTPDQSRSSEQRVHVLLSFLPPQKVSCTHTDLPLLNLCIAVIPSACIKCALRKSIKNVSVVSMLLSDVVLHNFKSVWWPSEKVSFCTLVLGKKVILLDSFFSGTQWMLQPTKSSPFCGLIEKDSLKCMLS